MCLGGVEQSICLSPVTQLSVIFKAVYFERLFSIVFDKNANLFSFVPSKAFHFHQHFGCDFQSLWIAVVFMTGFILDFLECGFT